MSGKKYYCFCSSNCKYETMTKEQILAAITQAVESGTVSDVDTGFVTKIKELNSGKAVTMWVGTTAQYNALTEHVENCIYIKVDDTTGEDVGKAISNLMADMDEATKELQVAKSFLSVAGADNGVLQDALEVAWRDTYADINKPRKVTMDTANIPADFGGGTRFVVISDSDMRFGCVVLVGQRKNYYNNDGVFGDVWINRNMGSNWAGWVRLGANDYVVEQGTDGVWNYRKWSSGVAECWGKTQFTVTTTANDTVFQGVTDPILFPSGLFADVPIPTWSHYGNANINSSVSWLEKHGCGLLCNTTWALTDTTIDCWMQVNGRWK